MNAETPADKDHPPLTKAEGVWPNGGALDPDRRVGAESRKSYRQKIADGFFEKYLAGDAILEVGYKGYDEGSVPIVPQAIGVDLDYPGYDGVTLPFPNESQDAVYSSHCFEHIENYKDTLRDWFRVLKVGGYIVIVVPHQFLFERRRELPSRWNADHKRFYTPASLLREIEEALPPNSYRVGHLADNDAGFDYSKTPLEAGVGCCEIELVVQKRAIPRWELDDGASRLYGPSEFHSCLSRPRPMLIETDFSITNRCVIWGPYVLAAAGDYEVTFFFDALGLDDNQLESAIEFDVANQDGRFASVILLGTEGISMLRHGSVSLRFSHTKATSLLEFRVITRDRPFAGKLRFLGAFLNRIYGSS